MISSIILKRIKEIKDPLIRKRYLKYANLPEDIRQMFFAPETAEKINRIATENNLTSPQLWWFSYTIGLILLGELKITEFVKNIIQKCKLNEDLAKKIAYEAARVVFVPVRESLKKIQAEIEKKEDEPIKKSTYIEPNQVEPKLEGNLVDLKSNNIKHEL